MKRIQDILVVLAVNCIWIGILTVCMLGLPFVAIIWANGPIGGKGLSIVVFFGMPLGLVIGVILITITGIYTKIYNYSRVKLGGDIPDKSIRS